MKVFLDVVKHVVVLDEVSLEEFDHLKCDKQRNRNEVLEKDEPLKEGCQKNEPKGTVKTKVYVCESVLVCGREQGICKCGQDADHHLDSDYQYDVNVRL